MNENTRKKLYALLVAEDGEYCRCCGLLPSEGQLVQCAVSELAKKNIKKELPGQQHTEHPSITSRSKEVNFD